MRYPEFAQRVRTAIEEAGLWASQRKMATKLKVSPSTINNWLTGEKLPAHDTAIRLAARLGVSVEWLMTGSGPMRHTESVDSRVDRLPPEAREFFFSTLEMLESKYLASSKANNPNKKP